MEQPHVRPRTGGRAARVREAVLQAAMTLLRSDGINEVTIARVAKSAGVHETSIYRRWKTREGLIYDALASVAEDVSLIPNTGDIVEDLAEFALGVAALMESPEGRALIFALALGGDDPDVAELRRKLWHMRLDTVGVMIRRAAERGQLRADIDPDLAIEMLAGPIYMRVLMTHERLTQQLARRLAANLVEGIGAR